MVPCAYIADGHHRSAAAARYAAAHGFEGESRWFLAVAFPASQLKILPYNRLVRDLNGLSPYEFMSAVSQNFTIGAGGSRSCRMYFDGKWTELSWDVPSGAGAVASLDVSALEAKVDSGEAAVAFSMRGVGVEEMMAIADAGEIMPPKSTWFEPKLRSGLFIHPVS